CLGESVLCRPESAVNRNKRRTMAQTEPGVMFARPSNAKPTQPANFYEVPDPFYGNPPDDPSFSPIPCGLSIAFCALEVFLSVGLLKAVIGLASQPVALWGLRDLISELETKLRLSEQGKSGNREIAQRQEGQRVGALILFCMNLFCICMLPFLLCGIAEPQSRRHTKVRL
ncbi:unnamed protein product, partial [Ixodes hexagonus]